ncbi:MAG: class I SAM-dependent methyltransferase [Acidobacteriia bacterium]|nr:class I SAM-dependent methyltransferase [Terriglobia bacterium]
METPHTEVSSPYRLKPGPYSSHTMLLEEFPPRGDGRRVLDVGCAVGYLSEILAQRGFAVTSVDWPNTPHPPTVEFAGTDLDDGLPPLQGRFDYIICADVLEHLRAPLELLRECRERLAPDGLLVASLPNSGHAWFRWTVLRGRFPQHERGLFDSTHLHFYTWQGWVDLFARAGLAIGAVRSSAVPIGLAFSAWDNSWPVRALEWLSFISARAWKKLFAYQFIVRARAAAAPPTYPRT